MANNSYPPGSRAIKIPISRMKESYGTPSRRRSKRDDSMQRTDSTEGSSSETGSASISQDRTFLKTSNTIVSPANLTMHPPTSTTEQASTSTRRKDKQRAADTHVPPPAASLPTRPVSSYAYCSSLSPSMLSSSSYKSINLNAHNSSDPDSPARLITYTKHSQGFTWNDELFLPSYLVGRRYRGSKNRRRWGYGGDDMNANLDGEDDADVPFDEEADRCPVMDIFVTDEEARDMLP